MPEGVSESSRICVLCSKTAPAEDSSIVPSSRYPDVNVEGLPSTLRIVPAIWRHTSSGPNRGLACPSPPRRLLPPATGSCRFLPSVYRVLHSRVREQPGRGGRPSARGGGQ